MNSYVRGSARSLGVHGVRINAVAPGNILFEGSVWDKKLKTDVQSVERMLKKEVALARLGTPDEISDLVNYLVNSLVC